MRLIKIGTTAALKKRQPALENEFGPLTLLGVLSGGYLEEREIHRQFVKLEVANEWFRPHDDLIKFIEHHAEPWDGKDEKVTEPVRLRLAPPDHARLEQIARDKGLSMASYARLVVLDCINELARNKTE